MQGGYAQTIHSQFFNNDNPSFTDSEASLYNWNFATATPVATPILNISAGNTKDSGDIVTGEATRGRGFFFVLPTVATDEPQAVVMYTTFEGTSPYFQNNPQPRWHRTGDASIKGKTVSEIQTIATRTNPANDMVGRFGIQLNGTDWVFSTVDFDLRVGGAWTVNSLTDLTAALWYTGGFVGGVVDIDLSDNATINLTGSEIITGYALYARTANPIDSTEYAGSAARVRLDQMQVTVTDPASPVAPVGVSLAISGASDMDLSFESVPSQCYELEKSVGDAASWDTIGDIQAGTGGTLSFQDAGAEPAAGGKVFYRIAATN